MRGSSLGDPVPAGGANYEGSTSVVTATARLHDGRPAAVGLLLAEVMVVRIVASVENLAPFQPLRAHDDKL